MGKSLAGSFAGVEGSAVAPTGAVFYPPGSGDPNALLERLGPDLKHWYEVPAEDSPLITLNAGNVSQLNDRGLGAAPVHAVQATAINQPKYEAALGPNGTPCIVLQDVDRFMAATLTDIAAANRSGFYAVIYVDAVGVEAAQFSTASGSGGWEPYFGGTAYHNRLTFTGGQQDPIILTPALAAGWHLISARPLASGALSQIDGVTTSANFTGTDTVVAITRFRVGSNNADSGGRFAFGCLVRDCNAAADEIIKAYVRFRYGLTLA